jgi:hypothetical protein
MNSRHAVGWSFLTGLNYNNKQDLYEKASSAYSLHCVRAERHDKTIFVACV